MSGKTLQMSSFGINGRLGNQLFQYYFMHLLKDGLGCDIVLPSRAYTASLLFATTPEHNIQPAATAFQFDDSEEARYAGPTVDILKLKALLADPVIDAVDVKGYFQYHTSYFSNVRSRTLLHTLLSPHAELSTQQEIGFTALLKQNVTVLEQFLGGRQLLALHHRRGDYIELNQRHHGNGVFYMPDFQVVLKQVKDVISASGMRNTLFYICSDDLDYCRTELEQANLSCICSETFFGKAANNHLSHLLLDVAVMVHADCLVAANSSLSIFAALLNQRSKLFLRPDPFGYGLVSFHPWNTHVLCKRNLSHADRV